eukprot:gene29365-12456_t
MQKLGGKEVEVNIPLPKHQHSVVLPADHDPLLCSFVTFEDEETIQKVLEVGSMHKLGGKEVEVKNATPKGSAWEGDAPRGAYGAVQEGRGDGRGQGGFDQYDPYAAQGQYHGAYEPHRLHGSR